MPQELFHNPRIIKEWPVLAGQACEFISSHWGDVWIFEDQVVKSSRPNLEKIISNEISVMQLINQSGITLAPLLLASDKDETFYNMEKKYGVELKYAFNFMRSAQQHALAEQLVDFKIELENKVDTAGLKANLRYPQKAKDYLQLPETQAELEKRGKGSHNLLLEYLARTEKRKPMPIHGDLHEQNILIDPRTKQVSGIIDWAYATKTEFYEHEFLRLRYGDDGVITKQFAQNVFNIYCDKTDHGCIETDLSCYKLIYELEYNRWIYEANNIVPKMYDELSDDISYLSMSAQSIKPN